MRRTRATPASVPCCGGWYEARGRDERGMRRGATTNGRFVVKTQRTKRTRCNSAGTLVSRSDGQQRATRSGDRDVARRRRSGRTTVVSLVGRGRGGNPAPLGSPAGVAMSWKAGVLRRAAGALRRSRETTSRLTVAPARLPFCFAASAPAWRAFAAAAAPAPPAAVPQAAMADSFADGASAAYLDELEARWRENPASVDKSWVNFFRLLGARRRAVRPACGLSMTASNRLFAHALPHQTRAPPPRHWPKHLTPSSMAQRPRWLSTPPRRRRVRQVVR